MFRVQHNSALLYHTRDVIFANPEGDSTFGADMLTGHRPPARLPFVVVPPCDYLLLVKRTRQP